MAPQNGETLLNNPYLAIRRGKNQAGCQIFSRDSPAFPLGLVKLRFREARVPGRCPGYGGDRPLDSMDWRPLALRNTTIKADEALCVIAARIWATVG